MEAWRAVLLLAAFAGSYDGVFAATNGLDASFGMRGIKLIGPTPTSGIAMTRISTLKVLDDGSIVLGGYVWGSSDPAPQPAIGRLDADGNWDTSFADHGLFVLPYGADSAPYGGRIHSVDVFSDGSVLATGGIHQFGGYYYSCTLLIKLTPTGALASGFAPDKSGSYCFDFAPPPANTYWTNHSDGVKIDSDDTFFLTSIETNLSVGAVAHLDSSGILVNTYATNGIAGLPVGVHSVSLDLLPGHEVLACGIYVSISGEQGFGAARLLDGGDVDMAYGVDGAASIDVQQSAVGIINGARDAKDRLLLSSYAYLYASGEDSPYRITRLTTSGQTDVTFNGSGQQAGSPGVATFSLSGNTLYDEVLGTQPMPDGHILVVGRNAKVSDSDGTFNISLLRLNDDASWDTSFGDAAHPGWASINVGGMANSFASPGAIAVDPRNGRIVAGIGTSDSNGNNCRGLIRVVADRLFDSAFDEIPPMPNCPQ